MLTLPNLMRVTLVIAFFVAPILSSALSSNSCDESQSFAAFYSRYELPRCADSQSELGQQWPNLPEDEPSPLRAENNSYTEMFAMHKGTQRWRATIALAGGLDLFDTSVFDPTLQALKKRTNRSALNPAFVEPIWLETPTEEIRGEPALS